MLKDFVVKIHTRKIGQKTKQEYFVLFTAPTVFLIKKPTSNHKFKRSCPDILTPENALPEVST